MVKVGLQKTMFSFLVTLLVAMPAMAVVGTCVNMDSCPPDLEIENEITVGALCGNGSGDRGEAFEAQIIALCSSTNNDNGDKLDDIDARQGGYCWCKMVAPGETQWLYAGLFGADNTDDTCSSECARACADLKMFTDSLTAGKATAGVLSKNCPKNMYNTGRTGLTFVNADQCSSGYQVANSMDVCYASSDFCALYAPASTRFTDSKGTFYFTQMCDVNQ